MEQQHHHTAGWVQALGYAFAALAGLTIVLAFLTALWFAIRRRSRKPGTKERRTAVESEGTLLEDLRGLFDGIGRRMRRPAPASSVAIRRLYARMLGRAATDGLARPPAATPSQFAPRLDERYGSPVPSDITRAFVASRYGLEEFPPDAVRRMTAEWEKAARESGP